MKSNYEIKIETVGEEELAENPWLVNIMKNRLKQVFMTPSLVIIPGKSDNLIDRIKGIFSDPGHTCQLVMGIPGGFIELLIDNKYLIHFIFLSNIKQPKDSRISVVITQVEISPIANSDAAPDPNAE